MLGDILSLAVGGFYGGDIGSVLASWEAAGVFSYVLPFLLIFAIVFGIMMRMKIFGDNKGLNSIISLVIALLSLQFDFVPLFFSEIFPRLGIALSVILALIIITGLFLDPGNKAVNYGLLGVGVIIFLVVISKTAGSLGWYSPAWWYENRRLIIPAAIILAILGTIIASTGPKGTLPNYQTLLLHPSKP